MRASCRKAKTVHNIGEVDHRALALHYRPQGQKGTANLMPAVYVISKNGKRLMPTVRFGRVRHLLKDGKAIIHSRHPFTIQLTYDSPENIQPMEIGVDAGYQHIGISVKSTKREYLSAEFKLLVDAVMMIAESSVELDATVSVTVSPVGTTEHIANPKAGFHHRFNTKLMHILTSSSVSVLLPQLNL